MDGVPLSLAHDFLIADESCFARPTSAHCAHNSYTANACDSRGVKTRDLDAVLQETWSAERVLPGAATTADVASPACFVLESLKEHLNVFDLEQEGVLTPLRGALDAARGLAPPASRHSLKFPWRNSSSLFGQISNLVLRRTR